MDLTCSICDDQLIKDSEPVSCLKCGHVYHETCVVTWLSRSNTCPTCRVTKAKRQLRRLFLNVSTFEANIEQTVVILNASPTNSMTTIPQNGGLSFTILNRPEVAHNSESSNDERAAGTSRGASFKKNLETSEGMRLRLEQESTMWREQVGILLCKVERLTSQLGKAEEEKRVLAEKLLANECRLSGRSDKTGERLAEARPNKRHAHATPRVALPSNGACSSSVIDDPSPPSRKRRYSGAAATSRRREPLLSQQREEVDTQQDVSTAGGIGN